MPDTLDNLDKAFITDAATQLAQAETRRMLGENAAKFAEQYSLVDLLVLGGRMFTEVECLPEPYRSRVRPFFLEQLFGTHHKLLAMYRAGAFLKMNTPLREPETFQKFCAMIPEGCYIRDEAPERTPFRYTPRHRFFYYLMAAFTMFVLDRPGHPVGMPFPGGFTVEDRNGTFYCRIRDREKEVFYSICNFCPARQNEENSRLL
ncbi:MAG: DUF2115 domain-containing protein [Methanoregula sp.]